MDKKAGRAVQMDQVYRGFFEELKDMVCVCSLEGEILDVNRCGVGMLGYSSKDDVLALGKLCNIFHNRKNYLQWKQMVEQYGYVKEFEATLIKNNGELIAAVLTSSTIKDTTGQAIASASVVRDITCSVKNEMNMHRRNVELVDSLLSLKKAQPKLIQQEKLASIGQLAAGIAHELNNPAGFISSNFTSLRTYIGVIKKYLHRCEVLLASVQSSSPLEAQQVARSVEQFKQSQKLDYIYEDIESLVEESMEGVRRINEIVGNLRSFSRIDTENRIEQYDVNEALESTLVVAKNEIKYVAEVKKEFSAVPLIECIGSEINQVLLNIIVNAAQAIRLQKRQERGAISIRTYQENGFVCCEIQDNGPGIPEGIISRIFDPFFTTKEQIKGTGLGLSISYDIVVNKHGGELLVESSGGRGTVFIIKLPVSSRIENNEKQY